jgi:hypothetical protein
MAPRDVEQRRRAVDIGRDDGKGSPLGEHGPGNAATMENGLNPPSADQALQGIAIIERHEGHVRIVPPKARDVDCRHGVAARGHDGTQGHANEASASGDQNVHSIVPPFIRVRGLPCHHRRRCRCRP